MNETSNNQLFRVELESTKDDGKAQTNNLLGRDGEKLGGEQGVLRVQAFGLSGHVPKGAHGIVLTIGGNSDQAVLLGMEHPDHRPTGLAEGCVKLYDAFGQFIHLEDGKCTISAGGCTIVMHGGKIILTGDIYLGNAGASRAVSAIGTIDSAGHSETSNLLTKVWGI